MLIIVSIGSGSWALKIWLLLYKSDHWWCSWSSRDHEHRPWAWQTHISHLRHKARDHKGPLMVCSGLWGYAHGLLRIVSVGWPYLNFSILTPNALLCTWIFFMLCRTCVGIFEGFKCVSNYHDPNSRVMTGARERELLLSGTHSKP